MLPFRGKHFFCSAVLGFALLALLALPTRLTLLARHAIIKEKAPLQKLSQFDIGIFLLLFA
jgi:hypothetical protein